MNRITQCMHGRGTVSDVMRHRHKPQTTVPSTYLAFSGMYRPVIFWNLTDRCNLSCNHCYNQSGPERTTEGELTTAEALKVIDDLADMGVPLILFTGGEPLMRADIWDLAQHARNRGLKMALSTNGTLITPDIARRIKESGIEYAGISLDGARAETHDRFRNSPGAFEQTLAAFAACKEAGLRCGVRVTLTKENCRELEALVDLAISLGASRFCLYWLVPTGRGIDSYTQLQLDRDEVIEALSLLYLKAKETDPATMEFLTVDAPQDCIHLLASMEKDQSEDLVDARELLESLKGGCSAGTRVANIDAQGNVYPCQFARSPEFLVGSVRNLPFSRIWADPANPVLARFREKQARFGGRCETCNYRDLCGGGCRVRAYAVNENFLAEDPFCFVEKVFPKRQ
ncbi:radical SAM/SPASM domain-containing protein [Methanosphaerula palustris]|uniref:Radical SAM domain protein n=1 Tax=Methanosphaerula palustris (strain ATCC BAA-1556 / DSM 19958 / E1-9c) TaxID=521011 RepID=B8GF91_METPE|nr:radical SAM protein [Methanosphaerula palustris]ACL17897.1 Radical SAM domain protein [Methanosphaerula palustris E1-9c]